MWERCGKLCGSLTREGKALCDSEVGMKMLHVLAACLKCPWARKPRAIRGVHWPRKGGGRGGRGGGATHVRPVVDSYALGKHQRASVSKYTAAYAAAA